MRVRMRIYKMRPSVPHCGHMCLVRWVYTCPAVDIPLLYSEAARRGAITCFTQYMFLTHETRWRNGFDSRRLLESRESHRKSASHTLCVNKFYSDEIMVVVIILLCDGGGEAWFESLCGCWSIR